MINKRTFGPSTFIFPEPVFLVGVDIGGKPNFMTAAWGGMACGAPPMLTVAIRHQRYTMKGIKMGGVFAINLPDINLVKQADLCGIVSGIKSDKAADCDFDVFYGKLENAPLIRQCPVNLECKVVHILKVGSIEETHISEHCLTGGQPDIEKIQPILYSRGLAPLYYAFGPSLGEAFNIGNELKK